MAASSARPSYALFCALSILGLAAFAMAVAVSGTRERSQGRAGPPVPQRRLRNSNRHAAAATAPGFTVSYDPVEQYKSQEGQDKWANEHVFHGLTGGVFVDLGCYDGVTYSNTWYFERVLNWTGVCVEPNPEVYPRIRDQAGRSSGVQLAVADRKGTLPFVAAYMLSLIHI